MGGCLPSASRLKGGGVVQRGVGSAVGSGMVSGSGGSGGDACGGGGGGSSSGGGGGSSSGGGGGLGVDRNHAPSGSAGDPCAKLGPPPRHGWGRRRWRRRRRRRRRRWRRTRRLGHGQRGRWGSEVAQRGRRGGVGARYRRGVSVFDDAPQAESVECPQAAVGGALGRVRMMRRSNHRSLTQALARATRPLSG